MSNPFKPCTLFPFCSAAGPKHKTLNYRPSTKKQRLNKLLNQNKKHKRLKTQNPKPETPIPQNRLNQAAKDGDVGGVTTLQDQLAEKQANPTPSTSGAIL